MLSERIDVSFRYSGSRYTFSFEEAKRLLHVVAVQFLDGLVSKLTQFYIREDIIPQVNSSRRNKKNRVEA